MSIYDNIKVEAFVNFLKSIVKTFDELTVFGELNSFHSARYYEGYTTMIMLQSWGIIDRVQRESIEGMMRSDDRESWYLAFTLLINLYDKHRYEQKTKRRGSMA